MQIYMITVLQLKGVIVSGVDIARFGSLETEGRVSSPNFGFGSGVWRKSSSTASCLNICFLTCCQFHVEWIINALVKLMYIKERYLSLS